MPQTNNQPHTNPTRNLSASLRDIWNNYRLEVIFCILLSATVALSHWLSRFIPMNFYVNILTPIQNSFIIATCLIGAYILLRHSDGLRIRKIWAWSLLIWGFADSFFLFQTYCMDTPVLLPGSDALTAYELLAGNCLGWLLLCYPTETLRPGWMNWKRALQQLLPMMALVGLDYLIPINLTPILALYPAVLAGMLVIHIRAYRIWCEQNYSTMDHIDVQWIVRYLIMLAIIGASFIYICITDNPARTFTQQWLLLFFYVYSTEQILFRKDPWEGMEPAADKTQTTDEASNEKKLAERTKLEAWMETEKPYVNPDFQLMDLRAVLPMNRTYLSQFINDTYDCTFYQFVNRYRIAEAERLMQSQPQMKIVDVATLAGFSSSTVFIRIFTQTNGVTPKEWQSSIYSA